MATGSGKTYTAVNAAYRLIKFGGARRVLFLVDRSNLGRQTYREFQQFVSPVNGYKFTDEYHVQLLASNTISSTSKVVITTIQRLYSILKGEEQFDESAEEQSLFELDTRPGQGVAAGRLQRTHPHRGVRLRDRRRVPPLDLQRLAAGPGLLRRLPDRADRHARRCRRSASSTTTS